MLEALGSTEMIAQATPPDPAMRMVTAGHAVQALGLHGLGLVNQPRSLVPHFLQPKPLARLMAPGMQARPRHADPRGRARDPLDDFGGPALSRLRAAPAATRVGLTPTGSQLATTRCQGDGRSNSEKAPDAQGVPITHGSRRAHRPALHQGMVACVGEHHAGLPVLRQPLRGTRHEGTACGQRVSDHLAPLHTTCPSPSRVADSVLSSADNWPKRAETSRTWSPRVPATLTDAQEVLAPAPPERRPSRAEGDR